MQKYLKITQEDFAMFAKFRTGCEIDFPQPWFRNACEISLGVAKFIFLSFTRLAKFIFQSLALCPTACTPFGILQGLQKFRKALRICWMLDFFSDSHPCIFD